MKTKLYTIAIAFMFFLTSMQAQDVYLDQSITVNGVSLFRTVSDPNTFYYAPSNPRISKNPDGTPGFSFLMLTRKKRSDIDDEHIEMKDIEAGVVTAMIEYGLTTDDMTDLKKALKKEYPEAILKGSVGYKSGIFRLISSTANSESVLLSSTKAPLLEGSKAAISMRLDPESALILWATFKANIPDISFVFEMDIAGYSSPIKGSISCDLNRVYESHKASLGIKGSVPIVISIGADISATFDKLRQDNLIKIEMQGEDDQMNALIMAAYESLKNEIFERADEGYGAPPKNEPQEKSVFDRLNELDVDNEVEKIDENRNKSADSKAKPEEDAAAKSALQAEREKRRIQNAKQVKQDGGQDGGPSPPEIIFSAMNDENDNKDKPKTAAPWSVFAQYKFRKKDMNKKFYLSFEKKKPMTLAHSFAGNVGNMKDCKSCMTVIDLEEMSEFKQREVKIILESDQLTYFKQSINFVSINLRKEHKTGNVEYEDSMIDYRTFAKRPHFSKLVYGWENDNMSSWYEYEYRVTWSLPGNCSVEGEWQKSSESILAVPSEVIKRDLIISVSSEVFEDHGIDNIFVTIKHNSPCGKTKNYIEATDETNSIKTQAVRLTRKDPEKQIFLFSVNSEIEYTITATTNSGEKIKLENIPHDIEYGHVIEIKTL